MPNLVQDRGRWPMTLADNVGPEHVGVWCIFCLQYFDDPLPGSAIPYPPLQEHHPLQKSIFKRKARPLLPRTFPTGWTVPAHDICHSEHHTDASAAASFLEGALRVASHDLDPPSSHDHDPGVP